MTAEQQRRYKERHPERVKEAERRYSQSLKGRARANRAAATYYASEKGQAAQARHHAKQRSDPLKRSAWQKVEYATKSGMLVAGPCKVCGADKAHAHHHQGYDRPLDVVWLCPLHHKEAHKLPAEGRQDR